MKGSLLFFASSIMTLIAGCALFDIARKAIAAGISFTDHVTMFWIETSLLFLF